MNYWWTAIPAALISGYAAACHQALLDFSRRRLSEWCEEHRRPDASDILVAMRERLLVSTALVRTAMNLVILLAMIATFSPPAQESSWWRLGGAFLAAATVIAVAGVAIPAAWSRYAAEPLLGYSLPLLRVLNVVMVPFILPLHIFDPLVRRLLGVRHDEAAEDPLEQEILDAVTEGEISGRVDEAHKEMIEAVVEFPTTTVEEIMTPRTEIDGLPVESTLEQVRQFLQDQGRSRVPVYEGDLDHIVGILYVKDLIRLAPAGAGSDFSLRGIVREAIFVPESKPLRDLLSQFKASKVHLAMVLDEYGGTAGLVTIEDILEVIVGDIQDEYEPEQEEQKISDLGDRTFEVPARMSIDEVNDQLDIHLPDDADYETVGGFVFSTLGHIPTLGESFEFDGLRFTVTDAERTRVNSVQVQIPDRAEVSGATVPGEA